MTTIPVSIESLNEMKFTVNTNFGVFNFPEDVTMNQINQTILSAIRDNLPPCDNEHYQLRLLLDDTYTGRIDINELGKTHKIVVPHVMTVRNALCLDQSQYVDFNQINDNTIKMNDLEIEFVRTLRSPKNTLYVNPYVKLPLEPSNLSQIGSNMFNLSVSQSESIWLKFKSKQTYALKVGINGINLATGQPWEDNILTDQNFIALPNTCVINGMKSSDGTFRFIVPSSIDSPYNLQFKFEVHQYNHLLEDHCVYIPRYGTMDRVENCLDKVVLKDDIVYVYYETADINNSYTRIFKDYGFPSTVKLFVDPVNVYQIWYKNDHVNTLHINDLTPVNAILKKISYSTKIPLPKLRVICMGKQLESTHDRKDCDITKHRTLQVCVRSGGSNHCDCCVVGFHERSTTKSHYPASAYNNLHSSCDVKGTLDENSTKRFKKEDYDDANVPWNDAYAL